MALQFRKILTLAASISALAAAAWGVRCAMRSPMFLLQVLEVADRPEGGAEGEGEARKSTPVDAQQIAQLAAVPVGEVNLFELDLRPVEARLLANPWIREVHLEKHFPSTLSIAVTFREPQALMQGENGALSYIDVDGRVFGQVNLLHQPDLPILAASSAGRVRDALKLLKAWEAAELSRSAQISTLQWDEERGFRALVSYPLGGEAQPERAAAAHGRTLVDLGQDLDATSELQFRRLSRVFRYLSANRVAARQIWADSGKKIVVRTAHGS